MTPPLDQSLLSMLDQLPQELPAAASCALPRRTDFEQLYDAHASFIWRTVRSLGVPAVDVEDLLQEVFLVAFRRLGSFEGRSSLRTWLCGIAVGLVRNHTRKARRQRSAPVEAEVVSSPAEKTEAIDLVSRCVQELSEPLRLTFVLAELEQLSAPEIAEVLTVNLNTVYSRLRAARLEFEAALARHGGAPR